MGMTGPEAPTSMALCAGGARQPTSPTLYNASLNHPAPHSAPAALALPAGSCHGAFALTWEKLLGTLFPDFHRAFSSPSFFRAQFKGTSSEKPSRDTLPTTAPGPHSLPPPASIPLVSQTPTCNSHFKFISQLKINEDPPS